MNLKMIKIVMIALLTFVAISQPLFSETNQTEIISENRNTKNIFKKAEKEILKEFENPKSDIGRTDKTLGNREGVKVDLIDGSKPARSKSTTKVMGNNKVGSAIKKGTVTKQQKIVPVDVNIHGKTRIQSQTKHERLLGVGVKNNNAIDMKEFMYQSPQGAIDKARESFVEGIKSDPKKPVRVKGDPELADLVNKHTTHIKDAPGDKELRELVRKTKKTMDMQGMNTKASELPDGSRVSKSKASIETDVSARKKRADVDAGVDPLELLETAAQAFQSGTKVAGDAIDDNRELNLGDAVKVTKDLTPGVREYEATKATLEKRRLEGLERQETIRQLTSKEKLTLDEELELIHLVHEEKNNPNTVSGDIAGIIDKKAQDYIDKMNKRAKEEGREKAEFFRDGIPMFGTMMMDLINVVNPANQIGTPIAEGLSEVSTWDERQAAASQKDTMIKFLNSEAMKVNKQTQRNSNELSQLLSEGDLNDPEVQKKVDLLLAELQQDHDRLGELNAFADRNLQEVDLQELKYLRDLNRSLPAVESLKNWHQELIKEQQKSDVIIVPDVENQSVDTAIGQLKTVGLNYALTGGDPAPSKDLTGYVQEQTPKKGTSQKSTVPVILTLYSDVQIPDLLGLTAEKAKAKLAKAGFTMIPAGGDPAPEEKLSLCVQSQIPQAEVSGKDIDEVVVTFYTEFSEQLVVPSIQGLSPSEAEGILAEKGLTLDPAIEWGERAVTRDQVGTIQSQQPEEGESIEPGDQVKAWVYYTIVPDVLGKPYRQAKSDMVTAWFRPHTVAGEMVKNKDKWNTIESQSLGALEKKLEVGIPVKLTVYRKPAQKKHAYQALVGKWEGYGTKRKAKSRQYLFILSADHNGILKGSVKVMTSSSKGIELPFHGTIKGNQVMLHFKMRWGQARKNGILNAKNMTIKGTDSTKIKGIQGGQWHKNGVRFYYKKVSD